MRRCRRCSSHGLGLRLRARLGRGRPRRVEVAYQLLDLFVSRIDLEDALVPLPRRVEVRRLLGDVAEVAEGDQVLGIETECGVEDLARFVEASRLEQGLSEDDVSADVPRLLRQMRPTERDRLIQVPRLPMLVRQGGEVAARVLVEFFLELVKPGAAGQSMPSRAPRVPGGETGRSIFF